MPYQQFTKWAPKGDTVRYLLQHSIDVLNEYSTLGYAITLRQLYYQLVSRDLIPNQQSYYKRLGDVITKAREGGYVDWDAIVDRGRRPIMPPHWRNATELIQAAAQQFRLDRWVGQEHYVELWCEKDALSSILEPISRQYHVHMMANRGYSSATAMWQAAQRIQNASDRNQQPVIIYLGDLDPSGVDMTRDVQDRLDLLSYQTPINVIRLALNFDQVQTHNPPPNPTKLTDSRAQGYIAIYGKDSWELDALNPQTLNQMVTEQIENLIDHNLYDQQLQREETIKAQLEQLAELADQNAEADELQ